ncbi:MAG: type II toxin-antitoxin system HicB family antitoxin [Patescibacteria group bacterium]|nr:type II toxin-antitoxin system HicB family antitoxin [Patescibacteria group bacterium]
MERIINLHIEKLPEGVYLATSDDVQGLVAQGRTISEAMEIAKDVARRLLESQEETNQAVSSPMDDSFDCSLVVGV